MNNPLSHSVEAEKLDWLKDVIYTLSQAPGARLIFEYYEVQRCSVMV